MTSKTSLFNPSIFKNNVRRFWWGSLLYLVILILVLPVQISVMGLNYFTNMMSNINPITVFDSILFRNGFSLLVCGLLIVVPVLVALLLSRYLHVKKQTVAIHSLPATRLSLFLTNLFSGLTLMFIPIILNGIILLCYCAFGGFCSVMPMASVFLFVGYQLLFTTILFAVPVFFSLVTGNSILMVIFTYAFYYIPIGLCTGISYILSTVLFGYRDDISFLNPLFDRIPLFQMIRVFNDPSHMTWVDGGIILIVSICLFVLAYLFYKKRNLETAGDAISFRWLKPFFKYIVTICATVLVVTYAVALNQQNFVLLVCLFLISGVVGYFGSEMLLHKSFKIFKSSYKGFLVFLAIVSVVSAGVKLDVIGYEKRIPALDEIASASYGSQQMAPEDFRLSGMEKRSVEGEVKSPEAIKLVMDVHQSIISHKEELSGHQQHENRIRTVSYRLKSGKVIVRHYEINDTIVADSLEKLYSNNEYKNAYFDILRQFPAMDFNSAEIRSNYDTYTTDSETTKDLYKAIVSDIAGLGYGDISPKEKDFLFSVNFMKFVDTSKYAVDTTMGQSTYSAQIDITTNFKNTIAFLKDKGIYEKVLLNSDSIEKILVKVLDRTVGEVTDRDAIRSIHEDYRKGSFLKSIPSETNYVLYVLVNGKEEIKLGVVNTPPLKMVSMNP